MRDDILLIVFFRDILAYMFFFNDFQFLVTHVHKFHIFVAVFLVSMSHVHVSHHIIYLYKVVHVKCTYKVCQFRSLMFILIKTENV